MSFTPDLTKTAFDTVPSSNVEVPEDVVEMINRRHTMPSSTSKSHDSESDDNLLLYRESDSESVTIKGVTIPLNRDTLIDPELIDGVSSVNERKVLRGVEELATNIIATGKMHNEISGLVGVINGRFEIVFGQRRFEAVKLASSRTGKSYKYLAKVKELTEDQAYFISAIENMGRESVTIWEESRTLNGLLNRNIVSKIEDLGPFLRRKHSAPKVSRQTVHMYLAPARLSEDIIQWIDEGRAAAFRDIQKLSAEINRLTVSDKVLYNHLKSVCKPAFHSVKELIDIIKKYNSEEADQNNQKEWFTEDGQWIARLQRNDGSGGVIRISNRAPEKLIDKIENVIAQHLHDENKVPD